MRRVAAIVAAIVMCAVTLSPLEATAFEGSLGAAPIDSVYKVEGKKDCFRSTHFYYGGQPTLETLRWLKSEGVTLIVNLRSEKENKDFAETAFNEESMARELGMAYVSIPLGDKAAYCAHAVDTFAHTLNANAGKAYIHCLSCGRVSYLWAAYLVRHRGYALDEAVAIAKRMKYPTTLEDLLGEKVSLAVVN